MAATVEPLANGYLFAWGCLGGFAAAGLTLTMPWLYGIWAGRVRKPNAWRIFGGIGLLLMHTLFGGIAALMVGSGTTRVGQAIIFGFLWPTVFKSVGETGKELLQAQAGKPT